MRAARQRGRLRRYAMALPTILLAFASSCGPDRGGGLGQALSTPPREGRFGSLRDFVLIEWSGIGASEAERAPTYFFLDRFEVTRADWAAFAATPEGSALGANEAAITGDPALPVGRIDLFQARGFAQWRFARLPRIDEWTQAAVGDGRNRFPWGSKEDATRANTGELGLGEPTPVGTFESGRRADGWPYDLVGNVSEWTESVPWSWCVEDEEAGTSAVAQPKGAPLSWQLREVLRAPGLAVWQGPGGLVPLVLAVAAGGRNVPREVVGSDFLTPMSVQTETVLAGDRRLRTGLRLCTTPTELLRALLVAGVEPTEVDLEQLRRFVQRGRHRDVLRAAWAAIAPTALEQDLTRPLGRWLAQHLGSGAAPAKGGG